MSLFTPTSEAEAAQLVADLALTGNATFQVNNNSVGGAMVMNVNVSVVSGAGFGFTKTGNGTMILNAANTFTGAVNLNEGIIRNVNGAANFLGLGTLSLNGGELQLASTNAGTLVNYGRDTTLGGNATVRIENTTSAGGVGLARSLGNLTVSGDRKLTVYSQGLQTSGADLLTFNGTTLAGNAEFEVNATTANVTTTLELGAIGETGGARNLTKSGNGTLSLSGNNNYSGATDIQAGRVVLSGAGRLNSGAISVANASTGTLEFAVTGTNTMANNISGNGSLLSSSGETRFTGAVTSTGGLTINSNSAVRIGNGGATGSYSGSTVLGNSAAQLIFDRSDSYTHAGDISGNGSVVIAGAGTTTFTGAKTYTGLTTVSAGTLAVNGSVAGAMSVASGATLQGSGTISGNTTVSGNLKPGNSPGLLTFANSLTLDSSAVTTMEITGANSSGTRGTTYDAVNVTNALTYGGTLALNFDILFTQTGNYTFNLFDFNSTSGSFGSVSLAGVYSGSFTNNSGIWGLTDGDNNWSFNQGDGVLSFTVVPEPNVAMVAGSLVLMAMLRRRRD
jgi:autotransporter-associated beta strand protein